MLIDAAVALLGFMASSQSVNALLSQLLRGGVRLDEPFLPDTLRLMASFAMRFIRDKSWIPCSVRAYVSAARFNKLIPFIWHAAVCMSLGRSRLERLYGFWNF